MTPEVTVLLPVYNGAAYLAKAMEGILAQTRSDFELVIVDDTSTDGSAGVVAGFKDPRIRFHRNEENQGLMATLNRGLALARAPLVARHDQDDFSLPERLEKQVAYLGAHPEAALVGCAPIPIDAKGRRIGIATVPETQPAITWQLIFDNAFIHSSVCFRKSVALEELGGYSTTIRYGEDYDLWSRMLRAGHGLRNLREPLVHYRIHATSMTSTMRDVALAQTLDVSLTNARSAFPEWEIKKDDEAAIRDAVLALRFHQSNVPLPSIERTFFDLLSRFQTERPETRRSRDFRRVVARQVYLMAQLYSWRNPAACARLLARATRLSPGIWKTMLSWRLLGGIARLRK